MDTMIDLVGSIVIAGLIVVAVVKMNTSLADEGSDSNVEVVTQSNLTAIADGITYDFYKIGYRASPAILFADTNAITFRADYERSGHPDTVRYWISNVTPGSGLNPGMQILYRSVNGGVATGASLGQTSFRLDYFDSTSSAIAIPAGGTSNQSILTRIKSIKVALMVESPTTLMSDSTYAGAYWVQYISPKNLRSLM